MLGFLVGTACLIGLVKTLRHGCGYGWSGHRWAYCGPGGGYGAYGGGGCGEGYGGGWRGRHRGPFGEGRRDEEGWRGHEDGGPDDAPRGWSGEFGGFGRRRVLRAIFERLDTTPGQEKVIANALEELRAEAAKVRGEWHSSRGEIAKAVRGENFDAVMLGDVFGRHDDLIERLRKAAVGAMAKIHDVLDERQRGIVADMIETRGGIFGLWGYRGRV